MGCIFHPIGKTRKFIFDRESKMEDMLKNDIKETLIKKERKFEINLPKYHSGYIHEYSIYYGAMLSKRTKLNIKCLETSRVENKIKCTIHD